MRTSHRKNLSSTQLPLCNTQTHFAPQLCSSTWGKEWGVLSDGPIAKMEHNPSKFPLQSHCWSGEDRHTSSTALLWKGSGQGKGKEQAGSENQGQEMDIHNTSCTCVAGKLFLEQGQNHSNPICKANSAG